MRVLITSVVEEANRVRVFFECECGQGSAWWVGATPVPGDHRFIELEIEPALTVGVDMLETSEPSGLRTESGISILVGEVMAAEEGGYVRMELGCGGFDVEVSGELPIVCRRYRVVVNGLRVFDCDY